MILISTVVCSIQPLHTVHHCFLFDWTLYSTYTLCTYIKCLHYEACTFFKA